MRTLICERCNGELTLDRAPAGQRVSCPHCGAATGLRAGGVETGAAPVAGRMEGSRADVDMDKRLRGFARIYFWLSVTASVMAVGMAFVLAYVHAGEDLGAGRWRQAVWCFASGVGLFAQGFVVRLLLQAVAEGLRLLRERGRGDGK